MNYVIKGKVIRGDGFGKVTGYPTINLNSSKFLKEKNRPDFGVYAGMVTLARKKYRAGIVIGIPDKKRVPKIEAHLLEYSGNAYGKVATIEINKFLRKPKRFKTLETLRAQISKDLKKC